MKMKRQTGATLMETMIALALSVIVTAAMVLLMANSLGTANRITQMTQLTDELRNTMSMMTRDVRRANYSSASIFCYGNPSCSEHEWSRQIGDAEAPGAGDLVVENECLIFRMDRLDHLDGDATNDSKGGFRRVVDNGTGVVQMWVGSNANDVSNPTCDDAVDAAGWFEVSDPNIVNITELFIDDDLSAEKSILQDGGVSSYTQRQRQLELAVEGELVLERGMGWDQEVDPLMVQRRVEDVILVRNDYIYPPTPTP